MTIKNRIIWLLFSFIFVSSGYGALGYKNEISQYIDFYFKGLDQDRMKTISNKGIMCRICKRLTLLIL